MTDLTVPTVNGTPGAGRTRRAVTDKPSGADRVFDLVTLSAGVTVLLLLTLVGVFLLWPTGSTTSSESVELRAKSPVVYSPRKAFRRAVPSGLPRPVHASQPGPAE